MEVISGIIYFVIAFAIIIAVRLYINRNWELAYTVFGNEEYFKLVQKLDAQGVKYKTKTPITTNENRGNPFRDFTQFDIYVKKHEKRV
jgi:hypothetical protein